MEDEELALKMKVEEAHKKLTDVNEKHLKGSKEATAARKEFNAASEKYNNLKFEEFAKAAAAKKPGAGAGTAGGRRKHSKTARKSRKSARKSRHRQTRRRRI